MAASVTKVEQFLDVLVGAFDDLRDVVEGRLDPVDLREKTMLGSLTMLRVLAIAYHDLTLGNPAGGVRTWSRAEVEDFFRELSPELREIPIAEDNHLWLDTKAFVVGGSAPLARQGTVKALAEAVATWAREGIPTRS